MSTQRTHHVNTDGGVTIGGTVHGEGPPLVLIQGSIGDGDLDWQAVAGHLAGRFTCHLPSMRGRGLSGDHPDLSFDRVADDFLAYVESIGEPTGLVGWSAPFAPVVAAQSDAVEALVLFEPSMLSLMSEHEHEVVVGILARTSEMAGDGRLEDAARAFASFPFNEDEIATLETTGYLGAAARYLPQLLKHLRQVIEHGDPVADPAVLEAISAPVLVVVGSDTKPLFASSARAVTDRVPNARMREVPGAGHAAPLTHPEALAGNITAFLSPAQQPA